MFFQKKNVFHRFKSLLHENAKAQNMSVAAGCLVQSWFEGKGARIQMRYYPSNIKLVKGFCLYPGKSGTIPKLSKYIFIKIL